MKRSKKVIFSVHCLLNQNARADTVAKCKGAVPEFLEFCLAKGYGIVPIDCPQLMFEELGRQPATKEFYDNKKSRDISREVIKKIMSQIKKYLQAGYKVEGIYGVEGSPTCGAVKTHILSKDGKAVSVREPGIFFEELGKVFKKSKLNIPIYDWDIQAKKRIKN